MLDNNFTMDKIDLCDLHYSYKNKAFEHLKYNYCKAYDFQNFPCNFSTRYGYYFLCRLRSSCPFKSCDIEHLNNILHYGNLYEFPRFTHSDLIDKIYMCHLPVELIADELSKVTGLTISLCYDYVIAFIEQVENNKFSNWNGGYKNACK